MNRLCFDDWWAGETDAERAYYVRGYGSLAALRAAYDAATPTHGALWACGMRAG